MKTASQYLPFIGLGAAVALVLATTGPVRADVIANNLVGYYTFDDTANDSSGAAGGSGSTNHGSWTGASTYKTGIFGRAAEAGDGAGSDYISASGSEYDFGSATSFTVMYWINVQSAITSDPAVLAGGGKDWSGSGRTVGWVSSIGVQLPGGSGGDDVKANVGDGVNRGDTLALDLDHDDYWAGQGQPGDHWNFVALVVDRNAQTLTNYVADEWVTVSSTVWSSGVTGQDFGPDISTPTVDSDISNVGDVTGGNTSIVIGQDGDGSGYSLPATGIDDLSVWTRALSTAEIWEVYAEGRMNGKSLGEMILPVPSGKSAPFSLDTRNRAASADHTVHTDNQAHVTHDPGPGSLRQAIANAAPGDTVDFASGLSGETIVLGGSTLGIGKNLTIDGSTLADAVTVSGNDASRVFSVEDTSSVIMRNLTITGGNAANGGGIRIFNGSDLTFADGNVIGNCSPDFAGGIMNYGALTIDHGTISDNEADNFGAGLANNGSLTIRSSTFTGNHAANNAGGIFTESNPVLIENTTIAGNTTGTSSGAGIWSQGAGGAVTLRHVTVAGNTGNTVSDNFAGAGVFNLSPAVLTLENTIIADNFTGSGNLSDLRGDVTTTGANIVETQEFGVVSGPALLTNDPLLAPLGNYGGRTATMLLLTGSPGLGEGVLLGTTPATDQIGNARPHGALPDLGAVEGGVLVPAGSSPAYILASNDGDSIPDILEGPGAFYPHLDPAVDDSGLDSDGDGSPDADEILKSTDLFDHDDLLEMLRLETTANFDPKTNAEVTVEFTTVPGLRYWLEASDSLEGFQVIPGSAITATGSSREMTVVLANQRDFVRATTGDGRPGILFADNFNAPDTGNLDLSDQTGRRWGSNPAIQVRSARIQHGLVGEQLNFLKVNGSGRIRFQDDPDNNVNTEGARHDWASGVTGDQILAAGNLRVEFDWEAGNSTSTNWVSFNAGHDGESAGEPDLRVNAASNDIGILFRFNGGTEIWDNGTNLGAGGTFPPLVGMRHVTIDYVFDSFADGTTVLMSAWVGTTKVVSERPFTWSGNAGEFYMELGTFESTRIDNLKISTLPTQP